MHGDAVINATFIYAVCLTLRAPLVREFCALVQHQSSAADAPGGF
jgi:hypothetical protein